MPLSGTWIPIPARKHRFRRCSSVVGVYPLHRHALDPALPSSAFRQSLLAIDLPLPPSGPGPGASALGLSAIFFGNQYNLFEGPKARLMLAHGQRPGISGFHADEAGEQPVLGVFIVSPACPLLWAVGVL